jgi:two-component system LytT family response regulator
MTKVLLIDDEPLARAIVKEYLQHYSDLEIVQECGDGFEGLKAMALHQPELIFLDVQMPKINGFEMLELADPQPAVIFTTAFDEYALKAFEAHAIDYLLKPFSKERFDEAIKTWRQQKETTATKPGLQQFIESVPPSSTPLNRIAVKNGSNIRIIPVHEILYLEAYDDYVKIYSKEGMHLKKKTMNYFEAALDPDQFVRVHRSFLLHITEITRIEPYEKDGHLAILKSGTKIPVSKAGFVRLKRLLGL